jgi:O-antigen/teichoic acid export membrane protein
MPEIVSKLQLKISLPVLRKMLKFALPYLPGSLAAMIVQVIDVPIIEMLTNKSTLGIYRMSYKIGILIMLFVSMFNYAWQPFFLNNAKEKDAKEIFSKVFTIFLILLSLLWIVLSLFVEDVISFKVASGYSILHEKYWEGMFIIPIILLAYLFYGMYVIFTAGIYIEEKTKYFPIVTLAAAAVNVIVNFLLVPKIGIMGGALATLLSYIVMSGGLFIVSQKFYPIKYEMDKVWKILSLVFIVAFIYYYCYYEGFLNLGIKIILFAGFTALFFVLKIISIKEFQTVLKKLKRKGI